MDWLLLIVGLGVLLGGGEALVRGATSLARRLGVSPMVIGMTAPVSLTLNGGQRLLVGGAKLFTMPLRPGPIASWSVTLPSDPGLAGRTAYTQAAHLGGVTPFALSNAQDICLTY